MIQQPDAMMTCLECGQPLAWGDGMPTNLGPLCRVCYDWLGARMETVRVVNQLPTEQRAAIVLLAKDVKDGKLGGKFDGGGVGYVAYLDACGRRRYGDLWVPLTKRPS